MGFGFSFGFPEPAPLAAGPPPEEITGVLTETLQSVTEGLTGELLNTGVLTETLEAVSESMTGNVSILLSAVISSNGLTIDLTYSGSLPTDDNFVLTGTPVLVENVSDVGSVRTLEVDSPILESETVTIDSDTLTSQATTNGSTMVLETVIDTLEPGVTTWTAPAYPLAQNVHVICRGAGGAGLATVGPGGGGACAVETAFPVTGGQVVSCSVPAGGAAGGNSPSGPTTWDGGTVSADYGRGRLDGGAAGLAANSVGDAVFSGSSNTSGGAAGGSAGDASGTTGGAPDGSYASQAVSVAGGVGTGGRWNASNSTAGGNGSIQVTYVRVVDGAAQPYRTGYAHGRDTSAATTRNLSFSAGDNGDLLLSLVGVGRVSTTVTFTGHTTLLEVSDGTWSQLGAYSRIANGSDGVAFGTSDSVLNTWRTMRIKNAGAITVDDASGNSTAPQAPALTLAAGRYLVLAVCTSLARKLTAFPAGYDRSFIRAGGSNGTTSCQLFGASVVVDHPGGSLAAATFTMADTIQWAALHIAIAIP